MNLTRARTAYHCDHAVFTFFLVPVPQFFRLLIDYKETGKMSADCGEPGRLCLGWGGVRVREGGGREVYEGEFFCETVLAFLAIRPPASWIT